MARTKNTEKVFLAIYEAHAGAIFRHCYFRVYDRERARELMQEAFTRAWDYLVEGNNVRNLRALVYCLATRLCIDEARKKKETSLESLMDAGYEPSRRSDQATAVDTMFILEVLRQLAPEYREAVYMRYVDGLKPREIAEIIGESTNVISVRIHRGLKELRKRIPGRTAYV